MRWWGFSLSCGRAKGAARSRVTGAKSCVFRASILEEALSRNGFVPDALKGVEIPAAGFNADLQATPVYRAYLTMVMTRRTVQAALETS